MIANFKDIRIVVDKREQKSGIPSLLKSIGLDVEIKTLVIGDYIVAPETVVERKSINDLLSSIFDGRLFDQCNRLKTHFSNPVLLMEGNIDILEKITDNSLIFYGALSRVALDFKIPVIPTPNAFHTTKLLLSLSSRKNESKGPFLKKIKKSSDIQLQQLRSLSSLPGVGEKLAIRMLEKFGSPLNVFNATSTELSRVNGLGGKRAKNIRKMLVAKNKHVKELGQETLVDDTRK